MAERNTRIRGSQVKSDTIEPSDLKATNSPSNTLVPSYDSITGQFTWIAAGGGQTASTVPTDESGVSVQDALDALEADQHTHANKPLLDSLESGDIGDGHESGSDDQTSLTLPLKLLGTPTFDMLQDFINTQSSGYFTGGVITDDGNGGINISQVEGMIRDADSEIGELMFFTLANGNIPAGSLTDNNVNYIYVDNNTTPGTPTLASTIDRTSIKLTNQFTLGRAYKEGDAIEVIQSGIQLQNVKRRDHERLVARGILERMFGAELSETGTSNLQMTAGTFYIGFNKIELEELDTSESGIFFDNYYWRSGVSTWSKLTATQSINITEYNPIAGVNAYTKQLLNSQKYGIAWIYISFEGNLSVVMGNNECSTVAEAHAVQPPGTIPLYLQKFAILVGKVIFKKNITSFISVESAWSILFIPTSVTTHNNLAGLNDGDYKHLTATEKTNTDDAITKAHAASGQFNQATTGEIIGLTDKPTPLDADVALIESVANSNAKRKLSWLNIKATLKTYFDGLYSGVIRGIIDLMEYSSDGVAQATWVTNADAIYGSDILTGGTPTVNEFFSAGYGAPETVDNNESTFWQTSGGALPHWWHYDLGSGVTKTARKLRTKSQATTAIKDFNLQGSTNNSTWDTLYTGTALENANWQDFTFTNSTAYRYYKINITSNYRVDGYIGITEIELLEITGYFLQSHSEATIKTQGSYALKILASITNSNGKTLTRTVSPTINLTGANTIKINVRASRTGSNFKVGLVDAGATTEFTPNILVANTGQTETVDLSGVSDANKNAITNIVITILNADAANTIYLDDFYAEVTSYYVTI